MSKGDHQRDRARTEAHIAVHADSNNKTEFRLSLVEEVESGKPRPIGADCLTQLKQRVDDMRDILIGMEADPAPLHPVAAPRPTRPETSLSRRSMSVLNGAERRVVVVDREGPFRARLRSEFEAQSYEVAACDRDKAIATARTFSPAFVVTEVRFGSDHREGCDLIEELLDAFTHLGVVIVSDFLSVATTVWAIKRGVTAVLPKPASASQILSALGGASSQQPAENARHFSLQRATREYIMQCLHECDSLAAAARRLGVQPRSLRRMLSRNAPAR